MYDVMCFVRGGRGTMKSALFVFGGGYGERWVDEVLFECEL